MNTSDKKTIEIRVERTIPAPPTEVYDAWLNPETPGTPWHESTKLILNPAVDGMFYWRFKETPHFGRFTEMKRGARIQHTWMSPNTMGVESTVTVTFQKKGDDTLMTLVHSGLPDNDKARGHDDGWNYFLGNFTSQFEGAAAKKA
ncbi:MAG: SRPBCC family protein [Gemmatimonadaceae bacterium]